MKTIALAGNPNSGKSTLFNALTGSTAFVGNWPGVTVEKKEGKTHIGGETVKVMDLPGIYSMSPYSNEEIVSRDYILNEHPDVVVNIVDASNLERNLYLTTQILELGVPVVVALNMIDVVEKKGEELSASTLSKKLGVPVCEISAITNKGIDGLKKAIEEVSKRNTNGKCDFSYSEDIEAAVEAVKTASNGKITTDFVALKVLANDEEIQVHNDIPAASVQVADTKRAELEKKYDDDFDSIVAEQRYVWIKSIIDSVILKRRKETVSLSDKIDKVVTNKWLALPIFFAIIYAIYFICLNPAGLGKKLVGICFTWVINVMIWASVTLTEMGVAPWLVSLISDGMIFGLGIVIAFIPYLMVLFVFLGILEESGYMARVAFIMDRLFRRFGLSGKSFVPMLLGTGCTVQAVAATRTIENENDRRMTIFLTPFIPCATKMPMIMLVVGIITSSAMVAPLTYLVGIVFVILGGIFLKNTFLKCEPAPFVMELPEYKLPRIRNVVHFVWEKTVAFFRKVATIIFISTVIVWGLKYFNWSFQHVEIDQSMLASIGKAMSPIFAPLGFSDWRLIAAMLTGYVAKDNVIGTLGQILSVDALTPEILAGMLTPAAGVSFIIWFILSCPCFSAMGAMRKELGTAKLTMGAIAFQLITAYIAALLAFQVLRFVM